MQFGLIIRKSFIALADTYGVNIESNRIGFYDILKACCAAVSTDYPVEHLVYTSSFTFYGTNKKILYSNDDKIDNPGSLYITTKKSNTLTAHTYTKPAASSSLATKLSIWVLMVPSAGRGRPHRDWCEGRTHKVSLQETKATCVCQLQRYPTAKPSRCYLQRFASGFAHSRNQRKTEEPETIKNRLC